MKEKGIVTEQENETGTANVNETETESGSEKEKEQEKGKRKGKGTDRGIEQENENENARKIGQGRRNAIGKEKRIGSLVKREEMIRIYLRASANPHVLTQWNQKALGSNIRQLKQRVPTRVCIRTLSIAIITNTTTASTSNATKSKLSPTKNIEKASTTDEERAAKRFFCVIQFCNC